ncbi:dTDP-rhamnosyl transferase [Prevotella sp.]|uniref:dTDP-rhamnosyl transferase n=1 Tax=uncultured Prevotella sp. TaxID=159272 RepID=UPI0027E2736A|nr:dTDP-rhamnosyl transferase [uncultured Prevotella sp.]
MNINRIGVVIIVFHPNARLLESKLKKLGNDVAVVVVDNTPNETINIEQANITYIPLYENTGIANAQNVGIGNILDRGCTHVVFFDQDSDFTEKYVRSIVDEYERISTVRKNLFLLGPTVINKTNGEEYRSVIHSDKKADQGFIEKREIISSGSCVSVDKLNQVGVMDARLFIDYVDFEHCWRANSKGYVCGITQNVTLPHKVGNNELHFPHGYRVIISAPFRYYYQYRNWLWLCRKGYVPRQWKINTCIKFMSRIIYFPFVVNEWKAIEKNMFKGIHDGLFK